jgi:hypothetical protein
VGTDPIWGRASIQDWLAAHVPLMFGGFGAILLAAFAGMFF